MDYTANMLLGAKTWLLLMLAIPLGACGGSGAVAESAMPNGGLDNTQLAKCSVAASHEQPLVTEWPASYKARLESMLMQGVVAVEYSGCEMQIVDRCVLPGTYAWKKTTLSTDTTDISDEDDLYAKLPLGAVSLAGQLKTKGSLHVQTTVSGQLQLVGEAATDATSGAECQRATHLVMALSIGAFSLMAGGEVSGSATLEHPVVSAGGHAAQSKSVLRSAGDPSSCAHATAHDPDPDCRSPIQIFLTPIRRSVPLQQLAPLPREQG